LIFDLLTERSEPTEPIFGINKSHVNLVSVIRKIGSDRSDRSVSHQKVNCMVILRFMYPNSCINNLDNQKAKVGIKVGESQASGGTQAREKRWEATRGA
jgi:hypothetical protein